mgnify:CR=1 FL=1
MSVTPLKTEEMYKIRFHLAPGQNFMKWQVTQVMSTTAYNADKVENKVEYLDPDEGTLAMFGCRLRNQKGTATKINGGANKSVCAWIECERWELSPDIMPLTFMDRRLHYNPRVEPCWTDENGSDMDNTMHDLLITKGRSVYAIDVDPIDSVFNK